MARSLTRRFTIAGVTLALLAALWLWGNATADRNMSALAYDAAKGEATGSWWFPRSGPYVIGVYAPPTGDPVEVYIDGKQVIRTLNLGVAPRGGRLLYDAGVHEVRVVGPPDTRLLWHPPGRRGAAEYVPDSVLSPLPPGQAKLGDDAGTSWRSGVAVLGMIVVALAGLLLIWPPRVERRTLVATGAVFALALAVRLVGLNQAGQTWDEDEYWSSGRNYVVNLLTHDFRLSAWEWNYQHPPVTKYIAGIGALLEDGFGAARALFAILGAATCAIVVGIAGRLHGLRAGIAAGVLAALTPHLIAHSRVVGHETPSVFFWALSIWLALRVFPAEETLDEQVRALPRRLALVGVALGLAVGTRFTNLLAAPVVGFAILVTAPRGARILSCALGFFTIAAAGLVTFWAIWPRMWTTPIRHLEISYAKLKLPHLPEPFLGDITNAPPAYYFLVALFFTTPLVIMLLAVYGGIARRSVASAVVVGLLFFVPFIIARSPVRQDGVRYVLPALLALVVAGGAGLDHLGRLVKRVPPWLPTGVVGVYLALVCWRIHPYYLDYFGSHVGGAKRVQERRLLEVGWWGEGIHEAVAHVNRHAAPGASVLRLVEPTHVTWFRGDLWPKLVENPAARDVDWIVVNDAYLVGRNRAWKPPAGFVEAHRVEADGAVLARVFRRDANVPGGASQGTQ